MTAHDATLAAATAAATVGAQPVLATRRELLSGAGALSLGSALGAAGCTGVPQPAASVPKTPSGDGRVPQRPFGRSGVLVSSLALGGYFDALANQRMLAEAVELGVTYWETTLSFGGKGYGEYLRRHPSQRDRLFLMAKSQSGPLMLLDRVQALQKLDQDLTTALTDIGTDRIDFFVLGQVRDASLFSDEVRGWVERVKSAGKVRFFGFSSHTNMQDCLRHASTLDWVDGAMVAYNYRLMALPSMQQAVAACARRGLALTAIKSQGLDTNPEATIGEETAATRELLSKLQRPGFLDFQTRLQAVWSNPAFCSICSMMTTPEALADNAAASWQPLPPSALAAGVAEQSESDHGRYCTGCAHICEGSLATEVPIADVMRHLMYARSYGDPLRARAEFAALGRATHATLAKQDYTVAEARCPQRLPITRWMKDALRELGPREASKPAAG